jgi:hypothetical protein
LSGCQAKKLTKIVCLIDMLMTKIDNSADKRRVIRVRKNICVMYGVKPIEGPEDSAKRINERYPFSTEFIVDYFRENMMYW